MVVHGLLIHMDEEVKYSLRKCIPQKADDKYLVFSVVNNIFSFSLWGYRLSSFMYILLEIVCTECSFAITLHNKSFFTIGFTECE